MQGLEGSQDGSLERERRAEEQEKQESRKESELLLRMVARLELLESKELEKELGRRALEARLETSLDRMVSNPVPAPSYSLLQVASREQSVFLERKDEMEKIKKEVDKLRQEVRDVGRGEEQKLNQQAVVESMSRKLHVFVKQQVEEVFSSQAPTTVGCLATETLEEAVRKLSDSLSLAMEEQKQELLLLLEARKQVEQNQQESLEDWAMEVVSASPSQPSPKLSVLGVPLWWGAPPASLVLGVGGSRKCWAMQGSNGYFDLRLGARIRVTGITLLQAAGGDSSSAPRSAPEVLL